MGYKQAAKRRQTRLLALGLIVGAAIAFVVPVRGYLSQRSELRRQEIALSKQRVERDRVAELLRSLRQPEVLQTRARGLGLILPGEKVYVLRGLPR